MDTWVKENPKVAAYIIYLSGLFITILVLFFYYYTKSQDYMSIVDRSLLGDAHKEKLKASAKDSQPKEVDDDEGFQIFEGNFADKWEKPVKK